MGIHDLSGGDGVLAHVETVARRALRHYDVAPGADVRLINVSENATFTVDGGGVRTVLRVHRLGYHSPPAIASELDWAHALRAEAGVRTPRVIPARDGSRIVTVETPGADVRQCVMFEFLPGGEPPLDRLVEDFEPLGAITARMHLHARGWARPPGFTRFHWDLDAAFGASPRWGSWRDGLGIDAEARAVLTRLEARLRDRLRRFGTGPERYGLIHADLRLANLLVDGTGLGAAGTSVIDFDDCGMGWYLYDFGAAVSFIEHDPRVPEMIGSWVRGYRSVADLPRADEDEIWTFVMFRRLLLVGWIGSHSAVDVARELGAGYTRGTCELAERYLATP
ncbi:phosphotransferase enzyme family protein [Planotetraspora kaengkrachanensis]|uniref:Aminoglycoside phosphotransferase n=1 Tax=Planotetraspora kaengkrachanensis TaxID=575193 RepID=A0A8J3PUU9_9ACTN|nr:phosphotransferase [Planotetraspora kaengkrachanensis]GIG81511.1 aminoglycoside phosphotransferase [Planotetraspora kaengkrachanensis]